MKPNPNSYRSLETEIIRWAEARKIIPNSTPKAQAVKTLEEAGELLEAATALALLPQHHPEYEYWLKKYKDAAGDTLVTLINGCALADVDLISDCLAAAYDEIKDRKGTLTPEGIFVKELPVNDGPDLPDWGHRVEESKVPAPVDPASCNHVPVTMETLFGDWTFCRHCHTQWTEEVDREYNLRTRYTPTDDEGSLC